MKPTVRYIDLGFCELGCRAMVIPLDHYSPRITNRRWVTTSTVLAITPGVDGPTFETRRTIYVPVESGEAVRVRERRAVV